MTAPTLRKEKHIPDENEVCQAWRIHARDCAAWVRAELLTPRSQLISAAGLPVRWQEGPPHDGFALRHHFSSCRPGDALRLVPGDLQRWAVAEVRPRHRGFNARRPFTPWPYTIARRWAPLAELGLRPLIERRSCLSGYRLWFRFAEPQPAIPTARWLLASLSAVRSIEYDDYGQPPVVIAPVLHLSEAQPVPLVGGWHAVNGAPHLCGPEGTRMSTGWPVAALAVRALLSWPCSEPLPVSELRAHEALA